LIFKMFSTMNFFKFFFFVFTLFASSCKSDKNDGNEKNLTSSAKVKSIVIICDSDDAFAYHNHICAGLSNCESVLEDVNINFAIKNGRTPCKLCY
jgi:hypothetical protein